MVARIDAFTTFAQASPAASWTTFQHALGTEADYVLLLIAHNTTHTFEVSFGGVAMTAGPIAGPADGASTFVRSFYLLKDELPPAGNVNIVINPNGVAGRGYAGVWSLIGATQAAPGRADADAVDTGTENAVSLANVPAGAFVASALANNGQAARPTLTGGTTDHANNGDVANASAGFGHSVPTTASNLTHRWTHQNARAAALMLQIRSGDGANGNGGNGDGGNGTGGNGGDRLFVAYYAGYDAKKMAEREIPWSLGLTHIMHFAAMPKVVDGDSLVDLKHFSPPLDPADMLASRSAAGSSAKVLLVLGGANTDKAFVGAMTHNSGTVDVTNGSAIVKGSETAWTSDLEGEIFSIDRKGIPYVVQKVNSGSQLTLTANYAEPTASSQRYAIESGKRRKQLIDDVVTKVADNNYDGVDTDWEFPGSSKTAMDRFINFHVALHDALKAKNARYILTSSSLGRTGPAYATFRSRIADELLHSNHLEFFFVQFYAMAQPGFSQQTVWHQSCLMHDASDFGAPTYQVGQIEAAQMLFDAGWPKSKLVVGCQLGTRRWIGGNMTAPVAGQGALQPNQRWHGGGTAPRLKREELYRDIVKLPQFSGGLRRDVAAGQQAFISHDAAGDSFFLSFDDPLSIATKAAHWVGQGIPNIGVWHAGSDYDSAGGTVAARHPLLAAISTELFG